jgi:hypothetical protein
MYLDVALHPLFDEVQEETVKPATTSSTRINTLVFIFVVFKVKQYKCWKALVIKDNCLIGSSQENGGKMVSFERIAEW